MPPRTKQREKKRSRECVESKRYPMYMMSAAKFLELYESGTKLLEHHQLLKSRGDLKLFEVSPLEDHSEQGVRNFRSGIRDTTSHTLTVHTGFHFRISRVGILYSSGSEWISHTYHV